jgi:uncharacterized phosphosugar-binding protein
VNGQRQAMFIERVEGLAETILSNFQFGEHDVMIVFSASGLGSASIEMATGARERGLPVVAVTSVTQSRAGTPGHSSGTRLMDHADIVIDVGTPSGDAMITLDGLETPVGPGSTLAFVAVVNEIKVLTADLLHQHGALPDVLTSATLVGTERSAEMFNTAYQDYARRLSRVLAGAQPYLPPQASSASVTRE